MQRIIGLISAWGAEDWIDLSIEQALSVCDDVAVNVGPYADNMKKYEDSTAEKCRAWGDKIRLFDSINVGRHDRGKATTLNQMLTTSPYHEVGNWIWLFDVDEYYLADELQEIKRNVLGSNYNWVMTKERVFYINMQKYLKSERHRLRRIGDMSHRFIPTNRWPEKKTRVYNYPGEGLFHYSTLLDPYKKMDLWRTEHSSEPLKEHGFVKWCSEIYMNYDLSNEDYWIARNKKLNPKLKGPFCVNDYEADTNGHLFTYTGRHPEIIERAGLHRIADFRALYTPC